MTQEQREHVEEMLIFMLEKAHNQVIARLLRDNSPLMVAAAELAQALVVLDESAPVFPLKARVGGNTIDTTSPVREIKAELPDKEELTADEAWELVEKAIRNSHAHAHAAAAEFGKLPPLVRKVVGRPEQLWDWYLVLDKWRDEVESNFREAFRSAMERENRRGGQEREIVVKGVVHIDTMELDAALAKAELLERILRGICVGGGTE